MLPKPSFSATGSLTGAWPTESRDQVQEYLIADHPQLNAETRQKK